MRPSTLLSTLCAKNQLNAALIVVSDNKAVIEAHAENQLEPIFIKEAVFVFIHLGKPQEAFRFLASVEGRIYQESPAYRCSIANLIEYIASLSKDSIERWFLSSNFTVR